MKKNTTTLIFALALFISPLMSQNFVDLKKEKSVEINGLMVSYTAVKKDTKKGSDLYRITLSITNHGNDYLRIFNQATESFVETKDNALAYFQFTNATGKALSATSAYLYPKPMYIKVPYKCKKCTPLKKNEDPYNHYTKSVIIGTQFISGSGINKSYNIRVPEGETPRLRVMIY